MQAVNEGTDTKLYHNNQNRCESQMCMNGIVGLGKSSLASVSIGDIELPIVFNLAEPDLVRK